MRAMDRGHDLDTESMGKRDSGPGSKPKASSLPASRCRKRSLTGQPSGECRERQAFGEPRAFGLSIAATGTWNSAGCALTAPGSPLRFPLPGTLPRQQGRCEGTCASGQVGPGYGYAEVKESQLKHITTGKLEEQEVVAGDEKLSTPGPLSVEAGTCSHHGRLRPGSLPWDG